MRLREALDVRRGDVVAFTGAGGKTSALVQLGYELAEEGWRVISTTTTRLAEQELGYFPCVVQWQPDLLEERGHLARLLDEHQFVFVYQRIEGGKVIGVPANAISQMVDGLNSDVIIVEADGSRRMPIKAPYSHEPVFPKDMTLAVPVAGLDAIGKPFTPENVYNIDSIIERYGFGLEMPIQPAWIAQIVRDEILGLKDIPRQVRIVALLNKTSTTQLSITMARRTARMVLKEKRIERVAIGTLKNRSRPVVEVQRRIGVIVLAGGLSKRMGRSKVLLPWGEKTVLETILARLMPFQFSDLVVVTGYKAEEVEAKIAHMDVRTIYNPLYASGEMLSSLKVGLKAMHKDVDACLVVLGDQPQVKTRTIHAVTSAYSQTELDIVAPIYRGQRGHPILIQRKHWAEILDLPKGKAPRDIINQYPVFTVESEDDSILRDIDTPEQYAQELRLAGFR